MLCYFVVFLNFKILSEICYILTALFLQVGPLCHIHGKGHSPDYSGRWGACGHGGAARAPGGAAGRAAAAGGGGGAGRGAGGAGGGGGGGAPGPRAAADRGAWPGLCGGVLVRKHWRS